VAAAEEDVEAPSAPVAATLETAAVSAHSKAMSPGRRIAALYFFKRWQLHSIAGSG
jgi:hypothetical protein